MGVKLLLIKIKMHNCFKKKEPKKFKMIIGASPYPNQLVMNNPNSIFGRYNLVNEIAFFTQDSQPTDLLVKVLAILMKSYDKAIKLLTSLEKYKLNHVDIASYLYYKYGLLFINRSTVNDLIMNQLFTNVTDVLVLGSEDLSNLNKALSMFTNIKRGDVVHPSTKASPNEGYFEFWVLHEFNRVKSTNGFDLESFIL